jgi:hypothetical protein
MRKITFLLFISAVFGFGFFSCKKDKATAPDMGYNYFPDQIGKYVVYDVDSFYYNDITIHTDTFKFQIKEKIESIFSDNQNRPTIRLERYIKHYSKTVPYSAMPWVISDIWAENKTTTTAEKVEENVRFIKLAFPVKASQKWDGNAQNNMLEKWDYDYEFFDQARWVGPLHFDSVLQVNQYDDKNKILTQRQLYIEKYARNVGMIYKQAIDVKSQSDANWTPTQTQQFFSKPILQRVTSGFQYSYTINSYGTEP